MNIINEIKNELSAQLKDRNISFSCESVEEHFENLEQSAEYISEAYGYAPSVKLKVSHWIEDTQGIDPDYLKSICSEKAETPTS